MNELDSLKKEISELRSNLNNINDEKEALFNKKNEIGGRIRQLIAAVKENKDKRNELTNAVKLNKEKRQKIHDDISEKIKEVKKTEPEHKEETRKTIREIPNIHFLEKQLEGMNRKFETEVMSFDKEQVLMKKIKELKRQKNEAKEMLSAVIGNRKASKEIDQLKKEANLIHNVIQTTAKESQEKHEKILEVSKEIDKLKAEEDEAYKKFIELKQKFNDANNYLREKLNEMNDIYKKLGHEREEKEEKQTQSRRKTLKQKEMEVNEKIRKGEKLTTDDILVLQGAELENN